MQGVVVEGPIEPGDTGKVTSILEKARGQISYIFLYSPGGDLIEGMNLGRLIRSLELTTWVPGGFKGQSPSCSKRNSDIVPVPKDSKNCICASACFIAYVGGADRTAGHLTIHRPRFASADFGKLTPDQAKQEHAKLIGITSSYMKEMEVPNRIIEEVIAVPSNEGRVLDHDTVTTFLSVESPARQEWIQNRCGAFEKNKSIKEVNFCKSKAQRELRLNAFEKYFKFPIEKLSANQILAWTDLEKYLDKSAIELKKQFGATEIGKHLMLPNCPGCPEVTITMNKETKKSDKISASENISRPKVRDAVVNEMNLKFGPGKKENHSLDKTTSLSYSWRTKHNTIIGSIDSKGEFGEPIFSVFFKASSHGSNNEMPPVIAKYLEKFKNSWKLLNKNHYEIYEMGAKTTSILEMLSLDIEESTETPQIVFIMSDDGKMSKFDLVVGEKGKDPGLLPKKILILLKNPPDAMHTLVLNTLNSEWGKSKKIEDYGLLTNVYQWENKMNNFTSELSIMEGSFGTSLRLEVKPIAGTKPK